MNFKKIKVLIVDDSLFFRSTLKTALQKDKYLEIIGCAGNGIEAQDQIKINRPDVITLDVEMPKMNGIEFLNEIISKDPIPIVLVSSLNMTVFEALDAGAVDFIRKPEIKSEGDFARFCNELAIKIKIASAANVQKRTNLITQKPMLLNNKNINSIIAIGASTGGTEATLEILKELPTSCPPIVITQHMPAGFTKMYADRLNRICNIEVKEAEHTDRLIQGRALIAPGEKQMTVHKDSNGYYVRCQPGEKVSGHCPSVNVLFQSVAQLKVKNAIGVILTGMGSDGAEGLLQMRMNGAYTIGQNKQSCVVYGMPNVAFNIGGVVIESPCNEIASIIIKKLNEIK